MPTAEKITLHALPPSHPCVTVSAALKYKGLEFERINLDYHDFGDRMEEIYGKENRTVPGLTIGDETIHGSAAILERLDQLFPEPTLYPEPIADAVREAETWGEGDFQDFGRRLAWGVLRFRPEFLGVLSGGGQLDPAGTDFAMKFVEATWKYHGITCARIAEDLEQLPGAVEQIETFASEGLIDGETPTAADFQIGATARVLLAIGDLAPILDGTAIASSVRKFLPGYSTLVPAGAFPAGWVKTEVPARAA